MSCHFNALINIKVHCMDVAKKKMETRQRLLFNEEPLHQPPRGETPPQEQQRLTQAGR